jgi:hypothetical protein
MIGLHASQAHWKPPMCQFLWMFDVKIVIQWKWQNANDMHTKHPPTKIFFMFYSQVIDQHVNIYNFNHHQLITKASRIQYKFLQMFAIFSIIPSYTYISTFTTLTTNLNWSTLENIHFFVDCTNISNKDGSAMVDPLHQLGVARLFNFQKISKPVNEV